jgi:hypothetical protein
VWGKANFVFGSLAIMVVQHDFRSMTLRLRLSADLPLSNDHFKISEKQNEPGFTRLAEEYQDRMTYIVFGGLAVMAMLGMAVDP